MNLTRRDLAVAGVFALGATTVIGPVMAATDDEEAVKQAVEALRKAIIAQDRATLETLAAEQLSYSHSDAHLEDKAKFINAIMTRKAVFKSLEFPELTVAIAGNNAIVRHLWVSESELDGKVTNTKIGVLQVWQKQGWLAAGRGRATAGVLRRPVPPPNPSARRPAPPRARGAHQSPAAPGPWCNPSAVRPGEDGHVPGLVGVSINHPRSHTTV